MPSSDFKLIELPKISDPRGSLSFVEGGAYTFRYQKGVLLV